MPQRMRTSSTARARPPSETGPARCKTPRPFASRPAAWSGAALRTKHARDAAEKRFEYYTPRLARKVFDLQRADFEHFGYPAWDGQRENFRLL